VYGVAGAYLLRFRQKHFGVAQDQVANRRAAVGNMLEAFGRYGRDPAANLRGRPRERPPPAQAAVQADRAFTSDEDQQRDEANLREVDVLEPVAGLKEDCSLLERDLSEIPVEKRESIGGQCRKQAVVPMAFGRSIGQFVLLSCPKAGKGWRWVFKIGRQIFRPRVDVGERGCQGVRARRHLRGREATGDDLPAIGDFPVPIAGRTVRRNVWCKCLLPGGSSQPGA
jgi:hypothetical protein